MLTGHFPIVAVLIGAAVGLVGQYISDVFFNMLSGKTGIDILLPSSSIIDYAVSSISGALAATGIGAAASAIMNGFLDGSAYIANKLIEGESIYAMELLATVIFSAATSGKGIDAKNLKGVYKQSKYIVKTTFSETKKLMYKAKMNGITKKIIREIGMSWGESVVSGAYSGLKQRYGWGLWD